jgi:hypothetical protein
MSVVARNLNPAPLTFLYVDAVNVTSTTVWGKNLWILALVKKMGWQTLRLSKYFSFKI